MWRRYSVYENFPPSIFLFTLLGLTGRKLYVMTIFLMTGTLNNSCCIGGTVTGISFMDQGVTFASLKQKLWSTPTHTVFNKMAFIQNQISHSLSENSQVANTYF